jgi:hypothetical protein
MTEHFPSSIQRTDLAASHERRPCIAAWGKYDKIMPYVKSKSKFCHIAFRNTAFPNLDQNGIKGIIQTRAAAWPKASRYLAPLRRWSGRLQSNGGIVSWFHLLHAAFCRLLDFMIPICGISLSPMWKHCYRRITEIRRP